MTTELSSGAEPVLSPEPTEALAPERVENQGVPAEADDAAAEGEPKSGPTEPAKPKPSAAERQATIKATIARLTARKYQMQAEVAAAESQRDRLRAMQEPPDPKLEFENPTEHQMRTGRAAAASVQEAMQAGEVQRASEQAARVQHEMVMARVAAVRDELPDIESVIFHPDTRISPIGAEFIAESEHGPRVAYYLGKNPAEAARVASLPPLQQGAALARIEATVSSTPARRVSSAPQPVPTLGGSRSPAAKDPAAMSMDEYVQWRRQSRK